MREHSGAKGGKNNNRNPTLKDAEAASGRSGGAARTTKKQASTGKTGTAKPR